MKHTKVRTDSVEVSGNSVRVTGRSGYEQDSDSEDEELFPGRGPGGFPEIGPLRPPPPAPRKYPQTAREAEERGASMITPILIGLVFLVLANYTTM